MTSTIKLISFDLDNTLWDATQLLTTAEIHTHQWLEQFCPKLTRKYSAEQLRMARMEYWQRHPEFRHLITRVRRDSLRAKLIEAGYCLSEAIELADLAMEVFMEARHRVHYYDHALNTLNDLHSHYRLAAISNGNACTQRLGLNQFDFHLSAESVGAAKPSPEPFELALAMANANPAEMVHIGDNPQEDIQAAANLGINTIWYNPTNKPWELQPCRPSVTVQCLSQIPAAIASLLQAPLAVQWA